MFPSMEERLFRIIEKQSYIPIDEIDRKDHFMNDLKFDSLDIVEFVMHLEEEFHIDISDEEAEKINTVEEAINAIKEKTR
jgi:acyl carrier protein